MKKWDMTQCKKKLLYQSPCWRLQEKTLINTPSGSFLHENKAGAGSLCWFSNGIKASHVKHVMSHDLHIVCPPISLSAVWRSAAVSLGHRQSSAGGRGGRDAAGLRDGGRCCRRLHLTGVSDEAQTETHRRPQRADDPLHLQTQHTSSVRKTHHPSHFTSLHLPVTWLSQWIIS